MTKEKPQEPEKLPVPGDVVLLPDGKAKITLGTPVEFGEETVHELVMPRPKGKHLRSLPNNPRLSDQIDLSGRLLGRPPSFFDEMDAADVNSVVLTLDFFVSTPGGGSRR